MSKVSRTTKKSQNQASSKGPNTISGTGQNAIRYKRIMKEFDMLHKEPLEFIEPDFSGDTLKQFDHFFSLNISFHMPKD